MIWFVVFHPKEEHQWWARDFGHVSLSGFENETWLHLDLGRPGVNVRTLFTHDDKMDYLSFLTAHHSVLQFGEARSKSHGFMRPMTCVSFVKHTLGVRSCALFPDQLFHILIRDHNAVMMNENCKCPIRNIGPEGTTSALRS
jgi:hypothetical protein